MTYYLATHPGAPSARPAEASGHPAANKIVPPPAIEKETNMPANTVRKVDHASIDGVPAGKGDGNQFARGLEVLLTHAKVPVDYDMLMGDLGVAFTIQASEKGAIIDGALDVGWWPLDPSCLPAYLDFVGGTVGRRIAYVSWPVEVPGGPAAAYREKHQALVEGLIASGKPVLAKNSFWWKVVTEFDRGEPPLLGFCAAAPGNAPERLPEYPWAIPYLGEPVPRLDRAKADLQTLRHAIALGRDEVAMPEGYVTGQKAFALWARMLRDVDHLGQTRWHANVILHYSVNRPSAVACLTTMAARHPGEPAAHLNAAAELYRTAIAELKTANLRGNAMQTKNGREALALLAEKVAGTEAQAVVEMEKALAAMGEDKEGNMAAKVMRENGAVWIEGVKPAAGGMSSVMQATATIMKSLGEDLSYDYLMGVSGHAFRIQMSWCPSSPHAFCGFDCWKTAQDALPYKVADYGIVTGKDMKPNPEMAKKALAALVASIDKGIPVAFGSEEQSVCIGYADGGATMLVMSDDEPFKPLKNLPWGIQVFSERKTPMERKQLLRRSLELAVKLWNMPEARGAVPAQGGYPSGKHAWEVWIAGLADDAKFERLSDEKQEDPDSFFGNALGNAWTYRSLVSARKAASGYLNAIAGEFNEPAAGHLRAAADLYLQVSTTLRPGERSARYPWDMKTKANWTKEMRESQAKIMKEAFPLDEKAVGEIEKALALMGK
jgi:hypothetical protein